MKTEDIKTWEQLKKDAIEQCAYMDFSDSTFMSEEIEELRAALADRDAKLTALEKQKPVAWVGEVSECATLLIEKPFWNAIPLFAAAGAAPVPTGWQIVPVEALTRWRDAFSEELSAWDIDPPLHHIQTSHDEISAILAAAGEPK